LCFGQPRSGSGSTSGLYNGSGLLSDDLGSGGGNGPAPEANEVCQEVIREQIADLINGQVGGGP